MLAWIAVLLKNRKTYIAAGTTIVGAIIGLATGTLTFAAAVQLIVPAVLGATIRAGVAKGPTADQPKE